MRLDPRKGARVRVDSKGWTWGHFRCPWCRDTSTHLGVGVRGNQYRVRCLICGSRRLPTHWGVVTSKSKDKKVGKPKPKKKLSINTKEYLVLDSLSTHVRRFYLEKILRSWKGLVKEDLLNQDIRVHLESSTLLFTLVHGSLIRLVEGRYLVTHGTFPSLLRTKNKKQDTVIVEGIGDGYSVPLGYNTVVLQGTGKTIPSSMVSGICYLCLDNDKAGRKETKRLAIQLISRGYEVRIPRYPGKDPAIAGKPAMYRALRDCTEKISMPDLVNLDR